MKKTTLKQILGVLILAIMATATIIIFKRLPPVPKLVLLAIDVLIYFVTVNYLIKPKSKK